MESVKDSLIHLFHAEENDYAFRVKYYKAMNRLYTQNYYKRLYDWCEAHNCQLTGHTVEEPHLFSQMWGSAGAMPSYRYSHVAGIDHLCQAMDGVMDEVQVESVAGAFNASDKRYKEYDKYFKPLMAEYEYRYELFRAMVEGIDSIKDEKVKNKIIRDIKHYEKDEKVRELLFEGVPDVEIRKGNDLHSEMCDISMAIKNKWVFPLVISNGKKYIALQNVLCDTPERPSLLTCTNKVERNIEETFVPLYTAWHNEEITDQAFYESYKILASQWLIDYKTTFADYIK
jgi:hypothetical protein